MKRVFKAGSSFGRMRLCMIAALLVSLVIVGGLFCPQKAKAAGEFSFNVAGDPIEADGIYHCSNSSYPNNRFEVRLINDTSIQGASIDWVITDENIVKKVSTNNNVATLQIIAPGYSKITVIVETTDGTKQASCEIHVPLRWKDGENTLAASSNGYYGLLWAQNSDTDYTLQIYTAGSNEHPDRNHYLRMLDFVDYSISSGSVVSETVAGFNNLTDFNREIEWSSPDTDVISVDPRTGYIEALSAGFATVTAKTRTSAVDGTTDELTFDVVVVPEASVQGQSSVKRSKGTIQGWEESSIRFETNAFRADSLEWRVFRGEFTESADITDSLDIVLGDTNGYATINNLKAGLYYVTAVPRKNLNTRNATPSYNVIDTRDINFLKYEVIVPVKIPSDNIILNYYNSAVYDSYDLLADTKLPAGVLRFSIDQGDENYASLDADNGIVNAVSEGTANLSISLSDEAVFDKLFGTYANNSNLTGFRKNNVYSVVVKVYEGIAINNSSLTMNVGETHDLFLTAPKPLPTNGVLTWTSSDDAVCTVDQSGHVTAKGVGEAIVTAALKYENGAMKRVQCSILVNDTVNSITFEPAGDVYIKIGQSLTITAKTNPAIPGAILKWEISDQTKVEKTVEGAQTITLTGKGRGTVVLTAINPDNGVVATKIIHVISDISGITLSDIQVEIRNPKLEKSYQLYADYDGDLPAGETLTWTSLNPSVVTVDQNGKVTILKAGTADVLVSAGSVNAKCTFTVHQLMEELTFDQSSLVMYVGETYRMSYTTNPTNITNPSLNWSSDDTNVATVDNTGFIAAINTGKCTITAQAADGSGVSKTCSITVLRNANQIDVDVDSLVLNVNESYVLNAQLNPSDSTDSLIFESSNSNVATVSATGKVTGKGKGSCVIFIRTEAGASGICSVTVVQQVTDLALDKENVAINTGESVELVPIFTPENASDKELEWTSSNANVASVDENGKVTGLTGGSSVIKCTSLDSDLVAYCLVTVTEKVTVITVEQSVEIGVGKKLQLNAIISGETATNKDVKWTSSNKKVCKVTKNGVIKGVKAGKCTIKVKAKDGSGVYAKCKVRVINATENIDLNKTYVDIIQGRTAKLKATTTPSKVTYSVVWSSSDDKVAIVSKKGKITAIKPGDCVITCTAGDNSEVYAVCYVHVSAPVNISSFNFSESELVMLTGESVAIQYSVTPSNYTEGFSWSSDNPLVASIDSKGRIVAKSVGTARITALSDSGKKNSFNVYVVGISKTKITLHQYESTKIALQIDGAGKGAVEVRWDTDNQSIAEISNGKVTGKALGTTTVYAIVNGRYLACTVKVIKN